MGNICGCGSYNLTSGISLKEEIGQEVKMKLRLLILLSLLLLIMPTVACSLQDVSTEPELPDELYWPYIGRIDVSKPSTVRGNWSGGPIEFMLPVDYKLELALQVDAGDVVFTVTDYWGYHKHDDVVSEGEWSIFSVTAKQNGEVYRCYFDYLPDASDYQKRNRKAYLHFNQTPESWERVK